MLENIYKGKVVLVTGHTGFKGSWLSIWLSLLGAKVVGISLGALDYPSNYEVSGVSKFIKEYYVDIRDRVKVSQIVQQHQPDFVFHLAAQPLVLISYESPVDTIETNLVGTVNILESLRMLEKDVVSIMITSDKVYDNVGWVWGYRETDKLGGKDPYSASKVMAELAIHSYVKSFFSFENTNVKVGITRAGNVIGGGDWAVDRIVPDCMKSWSQNKIVEIRNPNATRPWQHVLDPLYGYLVLGEKLAKSTEFHGEAYNFGPEAHHNYSVRDLIEYMSRTWKNIRWEDVSKNQEYLHESKLLKLSTDKALSDLGWKPMLQFEDTVRMTVEWYKLYYSNKCSSMYEFTIGQIKEYENIILAKGA